MENHLMKPGHQMHYDTKASHAVIPQMQKFPRNFMKCWINIFGSCSGNGTLYIWVHDKIKEIKSSLMSLTYEKFPLGECYYKINQ